MTMIVDDSMTMIVVDADRRRFRARVRATRDVWVRARALLLCATRLAFLHRLRTNLLGARSGSTLFAIVLPFGTVGPLVRTVAIIAG